MDRFHWTIAITLLWAVLLADGLWAQQLPPLPDRQMEITGFGYRINGRFSMLWYPGQAAFREEFTINQQAMDAYREYLKVAYVAKGVRWLAIGSMASLWLVDHTEFTSGLAITVGAAGGVITVPLSGLKRERLDRAVEIRNYAWYKKVRE